MCWLSHTLTILHEVLVDGIVSQVNPSLNKFFFKIAEKGRSNPPRPIPM